jgi:hypothetical protein
VNESSPFLDSTLNSVSPRAELSLPPPDFHPVVGKVIKAWFGPHVVHGDVALSQAQKNGLLYEKKAIASLTALFEGWPIERGTWIGFRDSGKGGMRVCQPDLFVRLSPDRILLLEVKARHSLLAWWQLRRLYQPVLEALYPKAKIIVSEVTKSYSHDVPMPESVEVFFSPQPWMDWVVEGHKKFAILQLKV